MLRVETSDPAIGKKHSDYAVGKKYLGQAVGKRHLDYAAGMKYLGQAVDKKHLDHVLGQKYSSQVVNEKHWILRWVRNIKVRQRIRNIGLFVGYEMFRSAVDNKKKI